MRAGVGALSFALTMGRPEFPIGAAWGERELVGARPGNYRNVLTGETLTLDGATPLSRVFAVAPLALLVGEPT